MNLLKMAVASTVSALGFFLELGASDPVWLHGLLLFLAFSPNILRALQKLDSE